MDTQTKNEKKYPTWILVILVVGMFVAGIFFGVGCDRAWGPTHAADVNQIRIDEGSGKYYDINNVKVKEILTGNKGSVEIIITGDTAFPFEPTPTPQP